MFERVSISSGNLKTDKILLNAKGHLKVVNIVSYPEDFMNSEYEGQNSGVQRFFAPEELRAMR